jgi:hypothetical protein
MIHLYTCCYNEIKILPFVVDYWKQTVDFVYVYDNYSTDGSDKFLEQYDWIKVIKYDTKNKLNDYTLQNIKNNEWKKSKNIADFVIICDIDECVFCENFKGVLKEFNNDEVACIVPKMYNLISNDFPTYNEKYLMHTIVNRYYFDFWEDFEKDKHGLKSKLMIINPNKVSETNYKVGCYEYNPIFSGKLIETDIIRCYHLHDVGLYRKIIRFNERKQRMSDENINDHLSDFYFESPTKIINDFKYDLKNSKILF